MIATIARHVRHIQIILCTARLLEWIFAILAGGEAQGEDDQGQEANGGNQVHDVFWNGLPAG
jgi:hypothetical protein